MARTTTTPRLWTLPLSAQREIWRTTGYSPTEAQAFVHSDVEHRLVLVAGGERGGKSWLTGEVLVTWVVVLPDGLYWIVGPDYEQTHEEFRYAAEALERLGVILDGSISTPKLGSWQMQTVYGGSVITKTADDTRRLASVAPAGLVMVEAAQQPYESWLRCRGRVAERRGPLVMSGTFEGSLGWYAEFWSAWQHDNADGGRSFSLPTWSNTAIFPGGRSDPEILALEATYPGDVFTERFGAVPCPPQGLVFREFTYTTHVTERAEFDPDVPVQLWIDPGYAHAYAVLAVQIVESGKTVYHIDEVYERGLVAGEMIERARARDWWPKVHVLVMDVAGRAHPAAESQAEIWRAETGLRVVMNRVPIVDGILRHRTFLRDPASGEARLLHHPRCKGTIAEYGRYKYALDSERRAATELPIDRDNDALKALAYGLVANYGSAGPRGRPRVTGRISDGVTQRSHVMESSYLE